MKATGKATGFVLIAAVAVLSSLAGVACSAGDSGLTRSQVQEVVRDELAEVSDAMVTRAEVDEAISEAITVAMSSLPENMPSTSSGSEQSNEGAADDSGSSASAASATPPAKSSPAEYTKFVVAEAISRYEAEGLDATVEYYNQVETIDGQWYVFIVGTDSEVIAHYDPSRRSVHLASWVGVDANGYQFGPAMLEAPAEGQWVTYVYRNPATGNVSADDFGEFQLKNAWAVRHDGLVFVSGWYINADDFTKSLVDTEVAGYDTVGLEGSIESLTRLGAATSGLKSTVEYYNNSPAIGGKWAVFIADSDGRVVTAPLNPDLEGVDIADVLGAGVLGAGGEGAWFTEADNEPGTGPPALRIYAVRVDDLIFGAGTYENLD